MPNPLGGAGYDGPGKEPARTITLDDTIQPDTIAADQTGQILESGTIQSPSGALESTPAPTQPDLAAQIAELKANYGQVINALGTEQATRAQIEQQLAEAKLQLEAQMAAAQQPTQAPNAPAAPPTPAANPPLPPGFTEEQLAEPVTMRDMYAFSQQVAAFQRQTIEKAQADMIRSSWDITPEEEKQILDRFPTYSQLPELQRVQHIQRAVNTLLRSPASDTAANPNSPTAAPNAPATPPAAQTLAQPPVPHVEHAQTPVGDTTQPSAEAQATAEYEAARKLKKPADRERAMTAAVRKLAAARGVSLDDLTSSEWRIKG